VVTLGPGRERAGVTRGLRLIFLKADDIAEEARVRPRRRERQACRKTLENKHIGDEQ
jgi:hypothetical protein